MGILTPDGRAILSGNANTLDNSFGGFSLNAAIAQSVETSIEPIVDILFYDAAGSNVYASSYLKAASGKIYTCGYLNLVSAKSIDSPTFIQLTLPV